MRARGAESLSRMRPDVDPPQVVTVPPALADVLDADDRARRFFESLSYSQQQRYVTLIDGAKRPETLRRRIERAAGVATR
jgi:uncharacterized protein YdeI (YjbR/CyaY-like superfamily)